MELSAKAGLVRGEELFVDSTTVKADAANGSLVPRFAVQEHLDGLSEDEPSGAWYEPGATADAALPRAADQKLKEANAARKDFVSSVGREGAPSRVPNPRRKWSDHIVSKTDPDARASRIRSIGGWGVPVPISPPATSAVHPETPSRSQNPDIYLPKGFWDNGFVKAGYIRTSKKDQNPELQRRLVFHVFGAAAEFERDPIFERTMAGLEAARARGKHGGRPRALDEGKAKLARCPKEEGEHSVEEICSMLGVGRSTLYRYLGENGADGGDRQ